MLTLRQKESTKTVEISGPGAEVMLFYVFWQSALWPGWMNQPSLKEHKDQLRLRQLVNSVNSTSYLELANSEEVLTNALIVALENFNECGLSVNGFRCGTQCSSAGDQQLEN